jgi:hypothetical protein
MKTLKIFLGIVVFISAIAIWVLGGIVAFWSIDTEQNPLIIVLCVAVGILMFFLGLLVIGKSYEIWEIPDYTKIDTYCSKLRAIGLEVELAPKENPEEFYYPRVWGENWKSLGLIQIKRSPILWVNVLRAQGSGDNPDTYRWICGIPDVRHLPEIRVRAFRVKSFPIFGHVIDLVWKGNDNNSGIIRSLSADQRLKETIFNSHKTNHPCTLALNTAIGY